LVTFAGAGKNRFLKNNFMQKFLFLLGGKDLEMLEIEKILCPIYTQRKFSRSKNI